MTRPYEAWAPPLWGVVVCMVGLLSAARSTKKNTKQLFLPTQVKRPESPSLLDTQPRGESSCFSSSRWKRERQRADGCVYGGMGGGAGVLRGQTGSGKTLAYLLPLIDQLRRDEKERGVETRARRPRALVLLPTRELVHQVRALPGLDCRLALSSLHTTSLCLLSLATLPTHTSKLTLLKVTTGIGGVALSSQVALYTHTNTQIHTHSLTQTRTHSITRTVADISLTSLIPTHPHPHLHTPTHTRQPPPSLLLPHGCRCWACASRCATTRATAARR